MPSGAPLQAKHFYDGRPSASNLPGDIWRGLPTFGVLPHPTTRGVVITPACDLAQAKTETITYLPIICSSEFLGSSAVRQECWLEIQALLQRLEGYDQMLEPDRFELPLLEELSTFTKATHDLAGKKLSDAETKRIAAYVEYVVLSHQGRARAAHLAEFFKADRMKAILEKLVTNALKPDIHFLPSDGEPIEFSAIPTHSVVLFRCPMTVPIEVLSRAQHLDAESWQVHVEKNMERQPVLRQMTEWPLKLSTLRGEFFADMISRYINMYIRLGSTDFERVTVKEIANKIKEAA